MLADPEYVGFGLIVAVVLLAVAYGSAWLLGRWAAVARLSSALTALVFAIYTLQLALAGYFATDPLRTDGAIVNPSPLVGDWRWRVVEMTILALLVWGMVKSSRGWMAIAYAAILILVGLFNGFGAYMDREVFASPLYHRTWPLESGLPWSLTVGLCAALIALGTIGILEARRRIVSQKPQKDPR
ncbi:MAG: hypothetical protein WBA25_17235 [Jannaschia sp.]